MLNQQSKTNPEEQIPPSLTPKTMLSRPPGLNGVTVTSQNYKAFFNSISPDEGSGWTRRPFASLHILIYKHARQSRPRVTPTGVEALLM